MNELIIYAIWYLISELLFQLVFVIMYFRQSEKTIKQLKIDYGWDTSLRFLYFIPGHREVIIIAVIIMFLASIPYIDGTLYLIDNIYCGYLNKKIQNIIMKGKTPSEKLISKIEKIQKRLALQSINLKLKE